jgi:hypothetical protein
MEKILETKKFFQKILEIFGNSQERPLENVLDEMFPDFGP